ncbi:Hsp20/alpha crystallin family protein [Aquabacterium sp. OR-4]|uniref:Hsp20/alpha crystallin family protein n=1 Tax=Aquabacterium sp. OR-4 TaxID=2978127 RepID=UPI0021B22ECC|nr:Hsp20/alpha crystallin family protein [Aquabacterium sp. OR-4]MDT7838388.1 Hsp20/alpha crystallin family protein [Aquabacterium sp. OR-4]
MLYRSLFPHDLMNEFGRLQRDLQGTLDGSPAIRGAGRGGYPALNVGSTPEAVEILAFAPGLDPAAIELNLERGVLTLEGRRAATLPAGNGAGGASGPAAAAAEVRQTVHTQERFDGHFRRVVSLPDDIDAAAVRAEYRDGVLRISVPRRGQTQPRRIPVQ